MKNFAALFWLDFKRSLNKRTFIVMALFMVAALYMVHNGVREYNLRLKEISLAQANDKARLCFIPSPMSVFFSSPSFLKQLEGTIDPDGKAHVSSSMLNGGVFNALVPEFMSFSGFIIYFGSLLALLFGFSGFQEKDYLKFLLGLSKKKESVLYSVCWSRTAVITLYLMLLYILAYLLATVEGVRFIGISESWLFFHSGFYLFLYGYVFILLGAGFGLMRSKAFGISAMGVFWILVLFIIPGLIFQGISNKTRNAFLASHSSDNPVIMNEMPEELNRFIDDYFKSSSYFPITGLLSRTREQGGQGFTNLREFYTFCRERDTLKTNYLAAYSPSFSMFFREPLTLLFYLLVVMMFSFLRFHGSMYGNFFTDSPESRHLEIVLAKGEKRLIRAPIGFIDRFFSRISGKYGFYGTLNILGEDIKEKKNLRFIYMAYPELWPGDLTISSLAIFVGITSNLQWDEMKALMDRLNEFMGLRFKNLDMDEQAEVIFTLAQFSGSKTFVMVDFVNKMTLRGIRRLEEKMEDELKKGATILYFSSMPTYNPPVGFRDCTLIYVKKGQYVLENIN